MKIWKTFHNKTKKRWKPISNHKSIRSGMTKKYILSQSFIQPNTHTLFFIDVNNFQNTQFYYFFIVITCTILITITITKSFLNSDLTQCAQLSRQLLFFTHSATILSTEDSNDLMHVVSEWSMYIKSNWWNCNPCDKF